MQNASAIFCRILKGIGHFLVRILKQVIKGIRHFFAFLAHYFIYVIAAVILTHYYQVQSSKREEAHEIMNATSTLIMKRMYQLQRVNFALRDGRLNDAQKYFRKYKDDAIPEWSINSRIYYQEIRRYFNTELANKLTHIGNIEPPPTTVHNHFIKAHNSTKDWKSCMEKIDSLQKEKSRSEINNCESERKNAENTMNGLKDGLLTRGTNYIDELNNSYQKYYQSWQSYFYIY